MDETELKKENDTAVEDLIKTTTRRKAEDDVKKEQAKSRQRKKQPERKDLVIEPGPKGLFRIKFAGGGQLPEVLKGEYTRKLFAQRDIDKYLRTRGK